MTVQELINELTNIVNNEPERKDMDVYIFTHNGESPMEIHFVDNSISDRVDINVAYVSDEEY